VEQKYAPNLKKPAVPGTNEQSGAIINPPVDSGQGKKDSPAK
jgi:hypothetical protein